MTQARGQAGSPPARLDSPRIPRVLIVEDEPALLRALRINLRARGYDVGVASAGREALAEARQRPPDVVVLDLGLPDLDGIEVIRDLRGWSTAPVIVLSGRAGSGDKIGALDAGADDYVTKPFDMEELLARLRAALRRDDQSSGGVRFTIGRCEIDLTAHTIVRHQPPGAAPAGSASAGSASADPVLAGSTPVDPDPPSTPPDAQPEQLHLTPGAAGQFRPPARRGLGTWIRAQHPLPPVPHGQAAPQAGGRPAPPAPPAHRAGHGLPLPALSRGVRGAGWLAQPGATEREDRSARRAQRARLRGSWPEAHFRGGGHRRRPMPHEIRMGSARRRMDIVWADLPCSGSSSLSSAERQVTPGYSGV
jgi:two-component system, OmpR family, KDP operon response regulator KdpE